MLRDSQVARDMDVARRILNKMLASMERAEQFVDKGEREELIKELFEYENFSEQAVNNARLLPVITGSSTARKIVDNLIIEKNNVSISYTKEGWFYIKMPVLLPKKEKGSPSYIRATLQAGLNEYFSCHERKIFTEESTIIFKHQYSKERKEREYRDHDNIELNSIVDMIALYVLLDDAPLRLRHYYCSYEADKDGTEIYVVPNNDFIEWLQTRG